MAVRVRHKHSDHFILQCIATAIKPLKKLKETEMAFYKMKHALVFFNLWYQSVLSRMTEEETCLRGHSTSETDSQGAGKELWSPGAQFGALGDPRCPPNAPDAYPFHTISLCVTNSLRSANGNG